jgi:geranylgeranyl diphosphate synthase type II
VNDKRFSTLYQKHKSIVERQLALIADSSEPASMYEPIRYVLGAGGKRLRAVLTLLACNTVGGRSQRALPAAVAIELLHNFTLVHDDVMDNADVRRGRPTVHTKWDTNVAILAGDDMVALAYRSLLATPSDRLPEILRVFTDAFVEVCEGQAFDKEFETRRNVDLNDYFLMIRKKTGRIIAASTEIGALIGGGNAREVSALRTFGEQLGIAFQLQDDLLDVMGDEEDFGKAIGGDIVEGKKTFLLLKALERARGKDREILRSVAPGNTTRRSVGRVRTIYERTRVLDETRQTVSRLTQQAIVALKPIPPSEMKEMLCWLAERLIVRSW